MNNCIMMGRLCAEPELKTTPTGISVTTFSLAVDRNHTSREGERLTDFIPCVAWRQTADFICRHFRKGQRMAVEGAMQSRSYTAKDGGKRTVWELQVRQVHFCEGAPVMTVTEESEPYNVTVVDEDLLF